MGQTIKSLPSHCHSVCKHSYGRNFDLILTKMLTKMLHSDPEPEK